ncbi:MAG TPA: FAD-dependent oxidoreductase [Chthoniobacterales bacterium]
MTVDDDADVLRAVERDLRQHYGERFRVMPADSGRSALEVVKQFQVRNDTAALFLVDQRMPRMTGIEFLAEAIQAFPKAKRVLLTAYADTDAAIDSINTAQVDYYLMKPWDPPEEKLYPVLDDLLDDWLSGFRAPFEGIRIVGTRWSPQSHAVKDFLAGNQVPYAWLDVETPEAKKLLAGVSPHELLALPVVIFPDGSHLAEPVAAQIASKIGLRTKAQMPFYDLAIIGGGPAGLAAAVYGASEGLRTVMVERQAPGGQAGSSSRIENYLGFPSGLSGADLARRAVAQARRFGTEILNPIEVTGIRRNDPYRVLALSDGSEISCHAVLIASGVSYNRLDVPGAERLTGSGVYYGAAATEVLSCEGKEAYIIGAANSAGQSAMYLSKFAKRVNVLVRGHSLNCSMSQYLIDQIAKTPNIVVHANTIVREVIGEQNVESVMIRNTLTGVEQTVPAAALFVFIGAAPHTEAISSEIMCDVHGFVLSGPEVMRDGKPPAGWQLERDPFLLETNVPGVFVAGDVRHGSVKRVASAVGEGAISVDAIHRYLSKLGA